MILYASHYIIIFINIANHVDYSIYDFFLYFYINLKKFSTLLKRILEFLKYRNFTQYF